MKSVAANPGDSKPRCLVLLLEPTPYILPRARSMVRDPDLCVDLCFANLNSSQPWGTDADTAGMTVLLNPSVSWAQRMKNVIALLGRIWRREYAAVHHAGWGHWVVRLAIVACHVRRIPFSVESDTPLRP